MNKHLTLPKLVAVAAVIAFFTLPIAFLISVSFKTPDDVLLGSFLPTDPTLANWPKAFQFAPLTSFISNSVLTAVFGGLINLALAIPAAYGMIRLKAGGRRLPDLLLSSYMAPPVVAMIPLFYLLRLAGLINSVPGLALVYGLVNIPVAFWLLAPFIRQVPLDVEQAAALDGAKPLRILVSIVCPMIAPGIVATFLIVVILGYGEFLFASAFSLSDATRTLTVGLSLFQGERLVNFGQMAAASLTGIIPVYIIALLGQRWLISGLSHGSVK